MSRKFTANINLVSIIFLLLLITSCQLQKSDESRTTQERFDKKSLVEHYKSKHFNLLVLWDQRIHQVDDTNTLEKQLKEFLNEVMSKNSVRIMLAGLDGNPPHFFLTNHGANLPSDYSSLFYQVSKLNLKSFERRYNPNISILKSTHELIEQFTHKKFFLPNNDFMVIVLTTQDDENYEKNMQGQKFNDKLDHDIENLLKLTEGYWEIGKGHKQNFTFTQLRMFVIAPQFPCHETFTSADRLFYASNQINVSFLKQNDSWKRDKENFNLCNLNFKNYFQQISHAIENRY